MRGESRIVRECYTTYPGGGLINRIHTIKRGFIPRLRIHLSPIH
jgi:hypothetical protein